MKNLLIIDKHQFGTLVDVYKWCEYLKDEYNITLICFGGIAENVSMDGVNIKYVSNDGWYMFRGIRYVLYCLAQILFFKGIILVEYFDKCKIFKILFPWKKMILDIRTLAVWGTQNDRDIYDSKAKFSCEKFERVTVISEGVKNRLSLNNTNVTILPLGADRISETPKNYSKLKLLYVGTLMDRRIEDTIIGMSVFRKKYPDVSISYDIIGGGHEHEIALCKDLIAQLELGNIVRMHGRIPHNKLSEYFDRATVGVSYVPITPFFDVQPVTKTFEYANSGLYIIGTATVENKKVINRSNGILINDTPEAFADAVEFIYRHSDSFVESEIRQSLSQFSWQKIVNEKLKNVLENI